MKYTETVDIHKPRDEVIAIFENPDLVGAWQKGFRGMEVVEGEPGKAGSKTSLHYDFGKREMTLVETVKENALPERFVAVYEAQGVYNLSANHFEQTSPGVTRWTSDNEFLFSNLMMKVMGFVMSGMFRKQTRTMLSAFRDFVEDGKRVDDAG